MSQPLAMNQRVQTRVYKHKSCRRFLQDYQNISSDVMPVIANSVNIFWQIANQKYKVQDVECAACRWFMALKRRSHFIMSLSASLHLLGVYLKSMASNYGINFTLKDCYRYEVGN